ncbi:hypothetical protein [Actinomyces wuliandei]|uniref:hypothetical protein n=1 Tax=Actinomyces wuliandei TaxID=2057743 RepID=UPI0011193478|nr:hypothetical protein [Actinomyces wuliandei]
MAAFQGDLRGMVDLLSRNLYSGPRVYVRELLQNTVDAIAARRALDPGGLLEAFTPCSPVEEAQALDVLVLASPVIDPQDCEVVMRRFELTSLPAPYLPDPDLVGRVAVRVSHPAASGVWSQVLGVADPLAGTRVPRLVLNRANPLIARLVMSGAADAVVVQMLRGLYIQCLLLGRQALGPKEGSWAAETLGALLDAALPGPQP